MKNKSNSRARIPPGMARGLEANLGIASPNSQRRRQVCQTYSPLVDRSSMAVVGPIVVFLVSALCGLGALPPRGAFADVPPQASEAPGPEDNAEAFAEYTVGVFLLESGSAQAAIPHLESAWEKSLHEEAIGRKLAEAYFSVGDITRCESVVNELLAADGDDAVSLLLKAKIAYLRSQKDEALVYLEKLDAMEDPSFEVERILAAVYSELGMNEKAVEAYGRALRIDAGQPTMQYQYGLLLREFGRLDEAEEAFESTLRLKPEFAEAALELASIKMERGVHAEAESVLVRLLEVAPSNFQAIEMMTNLYVGQGQLDAAIRFLESENRRSGLPTEGLLLLGRLYFEVKDYDESLSIFEGMLESGDPTPDLARVLGEIASKGGKRDKALKYYRDAIRLGPRDYRNYLALFFASSTRFTPEESQRIDLPVEEILPLLTDAARMVPPDDFDGLYLVGISYQSVDSLEPARKCLERAAEVRFDDERVILNLASVLEKMKRYEDAERHLMTLHQKQPEDPTTCNFYGYLLALMGKELDKAEGLVRKALESEPRNGYYIDSLGWVLFARGEYDRAVGELEKASEIVENDPVILEHLGDAYKAVERFGEALDAYEKSRALQPENEELIRKIDATRTEIGQ